LGSRYFRKTVSPYFADVCVEGFVFSARGCPFKCSFCATSHFWNRFRHFPVDWVIDEIKRLTQRGATHIYFSDDLFAASKTRLAEIMRRLKEERLDHLRFAISANASMLDDATCALLEEMNVGFVFIGFESGDDTSLAYLKCGKNTVEMNRQAIRRCVAHGLMCWGAVIIGLPGETEEAIRHLERAGRSNPEPPEARRWPWAHRALAAVPDPLDWARRNAADYFTPLVGDARFGRLIGSRDHI